LRVSLSDACGSASDLCFFFAMMPPLAAMLQDAQFLSSQGHKV
jgi:hypothetical protein